MALRRQVTYSSRPNHAARSAHARGAREFKTYDTSYVKPKRPVGPTIFAVVLAVIVAAIVIFAATSMLRGCSGGETLSSDKTATIVVAQGESTKTIGASLRDAKLIASESDFSNRVTALGAAASLKPGTYTFQGGTSVDDIIAAIQKGPVATGVSVTIPEGYTAKKAAEAVESASGGSIKAQDFIDCVNNPSAYEKNYDFLTGANATSLEGFLFPKTYTLAEGATADDVVRMMLDQFKTETASLDWSYPKSQGLSVYEAVNLASIVEKESSGDEATRARVAAVFYNRLETLGDPSYGFLQSDATTAYEVGHDPTAEEVHSDSPYSTYSNQGLPPTPICSPGLDCLKAVCSPDTAYLGTYYFFYFEGNNYQFSETYDEHMSTFS